MRGRERERVRACVLYYNTKQFYISGLTRTKDGSGHAAHLRNMIRLFFFIYYFFAYHPRWMYIPKPHTGFQKIQKKYPATSSGIKHKKLYLKSVFNSTT